MKKMTSVVSYWTQAILVPLLGLYFASCATSGGDQQSNNFGNYENEDNYDADSASNDFSNGNYASEENGNYGNSNYNGNNYNSTANAGGEGNNYSFDYEYGAASGEAVNNAIDTEMFSNYSLTNNALSGQALNNAVDDELSADAQLVNSGNFVANAAMNPAAGQSANALPESALASPFSEPATPPLPGGIVKYIVSDVSMLSAPGGAAVRNLSRGDHPVVYDRGEFHQTMDGYYIPSTSLSTEATGRRRDSGFWR